MGSLLVEKHPPNLISYFYVKSEPTALPKKDPGRPRVIWGDFLMMLALNFNDFMSLYMWNTQRRCGLPFSMERGFVMDFQLQRFSLKMC